jgi:hypothetical protein
MAEVPGKWDGEMLTFIFLFVIAVMAVGGVFIAVEAKRRRVSTAAAVSPRNDKPAMGRATPGDD